MCQDNCFGQPGGTAGEQERKGVVLADLDCGEGTTVIIEQGPERFAARGFPEDIYVLMKHDERKAVMK